MLDLLQLPKIFHHQQEIERIGGVGGKGRGGGTITRLQRYSSTILKCYCPSLNKKEWELL